MDVGLSHHTPRRHQGDIPLSLQALDGNASDKVTLVAAVAAVAALGEQLRGEGAEGAEGAAPIFVADSGM